MQGQLLDAFVDTLQQRTTSGPDLRFILETHSDTIVNRLGQHVAEGDIKPEDISIVIFEKHGPGEPTKVRIGEYDAEGRLVNWPYGFFDAQWDR
jgi:predicted ATPase